MSETKAEYLERRKKSKMRTYCRAGACMSTPDYPSDYCIDHKDNFAPKEAIPEEEHVNTLKPRRACGCIPGETFCKVCDPAVFTPEEKPLSFIECFSEITKLLEKRPEAERERIVKAVAFLYGIEL